MNERYLVKLLKEQLNPYFDKIWIHRKLSASPKFKSLVKKEFGYIPILQPEFDMVFKTRDGELNAIEAKQLTHIKNGYNMPYYSGIGQTIALQRFGFDHVGLWLFVDTNVNDTILNKYGAAAWNFIRNEIKLPMEYSYFKLYKSGDIHKFKVMQYSGSNSGYELLEIDSPKFKITWKYPNPIKNNPDALMMKKLVSEYLDSTDP